MAAYAALVSLLNSKEQMMNHPRRSTSLDNAHIQPLFEKAGSLLHFIERCNYGGGSKDAEDLEREIASAARAAEDVIESDIVDQIHDGSSLRISHLLTFLLKCVGCDVEESERSQKRLDLQPIIEEMDAIMKRATVVEERRGVRDEQATHSRAAMEFSGETAMVGFDDELTQLLDELTSHRSNRHAISIIGMGGMGKTTLARTVYKNLLIMQHFDIRAWATVSQQYDVKEIFSQLVSDQGKSFNETTIGVLGEQLHKTLSGRRYLIILDDVWSVDVWDKVRFFLPDNGNGSRIILTTRLSNVATDCGSSCFTKNLLNENESWELFCKKAFQNQDCPPELEVVGKEIVKLCKGLPLSVVVIGGRLLKSPRTVGYWEDVARDIKHNSNSKEKQESLDVLFSSYNQLPPHLKPCFLYTGVFKSHLERQHYSTLPISKMIKLWVAEGFLKPNGDRVLEEIAEDYLNDLIERNLILVSRFSDNGKMKHCDIHDLLRDLCLKVGEDQEIFFGVTETGCPLPRSIIAYYPKVEESGTHRLLRVFDARNTHGSPQELFRCVNLRYLGLGSVEEFPTSVTLLCLRFYSKGWTIWELPASLSLLWNLQTLTIRSYRIIIAPADIWKMRQLRHVQCSVICLPDPPRGEFLILENMQTLKRAVNLRLSEEVCNIIPNIKKLHLHYDENLHGYDDSLIESLCNLDRLLKLESLNLCMESSRWPPSPSREVKMKLTFTYPSSLRKLCFSDCELDWEDLTMIGSLLQLEILNLVRLSVKEGEEWSPIEGQFLGLKCLKIDTCDLVCWNAESCHFPILEKLVLRDLFKLEEIPCGIGEISTLKLISVETCSESAAISAMKIKEDQLETQGTDDLQIQVKMHDSQLQSLTEKVEIEGLTLDNIRLQIK